MKQLEDKGLKEIWKPIRGTKGLYEVSNFGQVKSLGGRQGSSRRPKIMKQNKHHLSGHHRVFFCIDRVKFWRWTHRLVLEAFVGPRPDGYFASHKDGNPSNNVVTNLEWASLKENSRQRFEHAEKDYGKLTRADKKRIRRLYLKGVDAKTIAEKVGCRTDAIWKATRPATFPEGLSH